MQVQTRADRDKIFERFRSGAISRADAIGSLSGSVAKQRFISQDRIEQDRRKDSQRKAQLQAITKRQESIRRRRLAILTIKQKRSLEAKGQIKRLAAQRGRGFTKSEIKTFLKKQGGSLSDLKKAQRKGFRVVPQRPVPVREKKIVVKTRNQRVDDLITNNKKIGVLTSRTAAATVIDARIRSEEKGRFFTTGEVQPVDKPKGFVDRSLKKLSDLENKASTKSIRTQQKNLKNELKLLGISAASVVIGGAVSFVALPSTIVRLVKDPSQIKKIPSAISKGGKQFGQIIRISPTQAVGRIAGEVVLLGASTIGFKVLGKVSNKAKTTLLPKFKGVKQTEFGVKEIRGVKKVGTIELIPARGQQVPVKIKKIIKKGDVLKQLRDKPSLPKVSKTHKGILDIVKKRGDIVSGSFAQQSLLKKKFTRGFKDLDIITKNRPELIRELRRRFGKRIKFKERLVSIEVRINGKPVADLVEFAKGEGGFVKKFKSIEVGGIKLVDPRSRLGGKLTQLSMGRTTKKGLRDIRDLTGGRLNLDKPSLAGAFGKTKKQLRATIGKRGPVITSQEDFFKNIAKAQEVKDIKLGKTTTNLQKLKRKILKENPDIELDRWLFASPFDPKTGRGQARIGRLGIGQKDANLLDILLGKDITLKKARPEILVFPDEKIFPKISKISKGKIKKTKGFIVPEFSDELEVVLGKGFAIKKGKILAKTIINGRTVPIRELKKIKITKKTRDLISSLKKSRNDLNSNLVKLNGKKNTKIINKQIDDVVSNQRKVNSALKKETGFNYDVSSVVSSKSKRVRLTSLKTSIARSLSKTSRRGVRIVRQFTPRTVPSRTDPSRKVSRVSRPSKTVSRTSRTSRKTSRVSRTSSSIRKGKAARPVIVLPSKSKIDGKQKLLNKAVQVFDVFGKSRGKFVKLNKQPLTRADALSKGAFAIDRTTARTMKIVPKGKTKEPGKLLKSERNYFNRQGFKLREVRIKKGRKFKLKRKYIERSKHAIDTKGEKSGLTIAKLLRQQRKTASDKAKKILRDNKIRGRALTAKQKKFFASRVNRTKRVITPAQRKKMLSNLNKARKARMKNLKGGKKK